MLLELTKLMKSAVETHLWDLGELGRLLTPEGGHCLFNFSKDES